MGFDKLLAPIAGQPVLWHSIHALARCPEVEGFTVVTRPDLVEKITRLAESAALGKGVLVVEGGSERHLSVSAGLATLEEEGFVAIHDAARPLVTPEVVAGCLALARMHGAASCASPVSDTVKRGDGAGMVSGSVDRKDLWAMQTPQIFSNRLIREAYAAVLRDGEMVTDEVSAVERLGRTVALYQNGEWNLKITFPRDISLAELILADRETAHR
ncbi:MAG: 2-C-methyl-D-erythritol 4-phosphate cytidylyltransferase [Verrucomicrobia bacterium]|nr:MAG: 2-C-methyl-D-erythritol 4-phosphate cytidylyltransferase [Verrucomicrobiota bacterium]